MAPRKPVSDEKQRRLFAPEAFPKAAPTDRVPARKAAVKKAASRKAAPKKALPKKPSAARMAGDGAIQMGGRLLLDLSRGAYSSVDAAVKEYVSNAWDAQATEIVVRIYNPEDITRTLVEVCDNGTGMTRQEIQNDFFRVGRDRRVKGATVKAREGQRRVHGRKGLGKLAGLKLCDTLELQTWRGPQFNGARLLLREIEERPNDEAKYHWFKPREKPLPHRSGTVIRLSGYHRSRPIGDLGDLAFDLSLWFEFGDACTVTLEHREGTFEESVKKGEWAIARREVFKRLKVHKEPLPIEYEENGVKMTAKVEVRWGWLEKSRTQHPSMISVFSGTRALSTKERFGLDRGWTNMFGIYKLVAEFRADWIDDMKVDVADVRREEINWELHPALEALRDAGTQWVKTACRSQAKTDNAKQEFRERAEKAVAKRAEFRDWTEPRKARLVNLVTQFASDFGVSTNESELDRLIDLVAFLLQNGALVEFLHGLRKGGEKNLQSFLEVASEFSAAEISGLLQVTMGKLDVVKKLRDLLGDPNTVEVEGHGKPDITNFLARAPWVFDPELRITHQDVGLKQIVLDLDKEHGTNDLNRLATDYYRIRPDLVCYVGPRERMLVIELKGPGIEMSEKEAQRVIRYSAAIEEAKGRAPDIVVVSGKFSAPARTLLKRIGAHMMTYAVLLDRAVAQLEDHIDKLEGGKERLLASPAVTLVPEGARPLEKPGVPKGDGERTEN